MRVRNETLDRFLSTIGEMMLATSRLRSAAQTKLGAVPSSSLASRLAEVDRAVSDLKRRALDLRTTPLLRVMEGLPRLARDVAETCGKRVEVTLEGAELELDRSILDRLYDPLIHLVRNAVDHGVEPPAERRAVGKGEPGRIAVRAVREGDAIRIEVADDGRGIDLEAVRERAVAAGFLHPHLASDFPAEELATLVFRPGLSTAPEISAISGRGVGMDAVRTAVESLGGSIRIHTESGVGTRVSFRIPIAAAVQRVVLVVVRGNPLALPIGKIERVLSADWGGVQTSGGETFLTIEGEPLLVLDLAACVGWGAQEEPEGAAPLLLAEVRGQRVALRVEALGGQQELYIKPLREPFAALPLLSGFTVIGDGRPVFLVDLNRLWERAVVQSSG